ncbi:hypothetical protein L9F63_008266, partial [Diploptera punctata]
GMIFPFLELCWHCIAFLSSSVHSCTELPLYRIILIEATYFSKHLVNTVMLQSDTKNF